MISLKKLKLLLSAQKWKLLLLAGVVLLVWFWFSLPGKLFDEPTSTVVFDREGRLLGARVADDDQWRFQELDKLPTKYQTCLIQFEDRQFFRHPGVNPLSLARAVRQNIKAGKIVSGGSTISMQVIRLSRKNKPRTIWQKGIEILLALRLEIRYSKESILALYGSNAPYGGNVVGLDAASWRYFGYPADNLSWAESATLAVLPNAPALIHPGRNRKALKEKRNRLLKHLLEIKVIDSLSYELACEEPLPDEPLRLPNLAPHLTDRMMIEKKGQSINTHIDGSLQIRASEILEQHHQRLSGNKIHNAATLIMEVETGKILAYIGNTRADSLESHANAVDIIRSTRSSGSILKPFLYASMLEAGEILPTSLIPDIPTTIHDFSPKNFQKIYDGVVPAKEALIRSLNVPAVRMLNSFGLDRFYDILKNLGIRSLKFPADHYGLSLILGGAEVSLWDLCHVYAGLGQALIQKTEMGFLRPASIYLCLEAMSEVRRPEAEAGGKHFLSSQQIAWKTGTSFGYRDAWAIGLNHDYLIGVWMGNADGEGRPGLTGVQAAAPLLFDLFDLLPGGSWFKEPTNDLEEITVCKQSGMRPGRYCTELETIQIPKSGFSTLPCPYHQQIQLDKEKKNRVQADCYPVQLMKDTSWFILPPGIAWFYQQHNPLYTHPPQWAPGCSPETGWSPMEILRPKLPDQIMLPRELNKQLGSILIEAAHNQPSIIIHCYLDASYLGSSQHIHKMSIQPKPGKHQLTLMDENGNILEKSFDVISKIN